MNASLMGYKNGQTGIVLRVLLKDLSNNDDSGKTGLAFNTSGLIISTIADNEATATAYTVAGSLIETISTLGTYAAPTATKCRFKEVDSTNHPGLYEIQIANARYAVSGAKSLHVTISGATDMAQCDVNIPLTSLDPYDSVRAGLTALPNAAAAASGGLIINGYARCVDRQRCNHADWCRVLRFDVHDHWRNHVHRRIRCCDQAFSVRRNTGRSIGHQCRRNIASIARWYPISGVKGK